MTVLDAPTQALAPGDRVPNFVLPDHSGTFTMFIERVKGRPLVLLLAGKVEGPDLPDRLAAFEAQANALDAAGVDIYAIALTKPETVAALDPRMHLWADAEGKISAALLSHLGFGSIDVLDDGNMIGVFLDANQRVLAVASTYEGDLVEETLAFYGGRPSLPAPSVQRTMAPVLIIPELLDPDMCQALIGLYRTETFQEGTVESVLDGEEVDRIYHARKKRLDHKIMDPEMHKTLHTIIGRRIAPEVSKAFHFEGFKFDRFLVCRYAADREDRFRAHRDNLSEATADRRFAMTLNLNGDEYEGGELVFPEYGPDQYKPGNGGAVIFSCSLLHEALPVTRGERFALLTFLRAPARAAG